MKKLIGLLFILAPAMAFAGGIEGKYQQGTNVCMVSIAKLPNGLVRLTYEHAHGFVEMH